MGILPFLTNNLDHHSKMECICTLTASGIFVLIDAEANLQTNSNLSASGGFANLAGQASLYSVSSLTSTGKTLLVYVGGGTLYFDGSGDSSFKINFLFEFDWKTRATVEFTKVFSWNTGRLPQRWYRVLGACKYPTAEGSGNPAVYPGLPNPPIPGGCQVMGIETDDSLCIGASGKQQFVQNLLGNSIADICSQLKKSGLKWELASIKRWSKAADSTDPNECNKLLEVPFRDIPECIEYTLFSDNIVRIGVSTFIVDTIISYTGSGEILFSGESDYSSDGVEGGPLPGQSSLVYVSSGGEIVFSGSGESSSTWETEFIVPVGASVTLENLEAVFGVTPTAELSAIAGTVNTACGTCDAMPQSLFMHHNLEGDNLFLQFVNRNGLIVPNPLSLNYSSKLKSWLGNFHLYGQGNDNLGSDESWRFTFEWACFDEFAGDDLGGSSWKFSMLAVRKNEFTGLEIDTRSLLIFPPDEICKITQNLGFDFSFTLNTSTKLVTNDFNISASTTLLNDKIGLFKSKYWIRNPNLNFRLSRNDSPITLSRQDLSGILPSSNSLNVNNAFVTR